MKRRCRAVEIACPGVDGERLSDGCRVASLLAEVEHAEPVGDEVQASRKAWDGSKTSGTRIPAGKSAGYSSELRRIVSPEPATVGVAEKWAIR